MFSLRSIRTRLALLFFAITIAAVGFVFVYVAPPLETNLREQRLESLAEASKRFSRPIVAARDAEIESLELIVQRVGDRANARVTVLRVSRGTLGLQTAVIADSTRTRSDDLQFEVATEAARQRQIATGTEASATGRLGQAA